jgi:hypothetical protein
LPLTEKLFLNAASLNLVRPELLRLIMQAQAAFAGALQSDAEQPEFAACTTLLAQVDAVFRLIELGDAARLARELRDLLQSEKRTLARAVTAAAQAFTALVRYPDYLAGRNDAVPELLLEWINGLRSVLGRPPLPENHFIESARREECLCPGKSLASPVDTDVVRRLRHLYQIGLIGMLQGSRDPIHVRLMQRATERMLRLTGGGPQGELWWLLGGVLEGFAMAEIGITAGRNRLLSRADREFRRLLQQPDAAQALDSELRSELVVLLSRCSGGPRIVDIRQYLGETKHLPGDAEIEFERELLLGPAAEQVHELGQALQRMLPGIRASVERMQDGEALAVVELETLYAELRNVIDKLGECGFEALAAPLSEQLERMPALRDSAPDGAPDWLPAIADRIVHMEAVLQAFGNSAGIARALREQKHPSGEFGSQGLLEDARRCAASTTREVLESVKRDLNAFADAGFNPALLEPSRTQLHAVAGALLILGHATAAAVAEDAAGLMAGTARLGIATDAETFVEAMADVLICLEYYLAAIANAEELDPIMLDVARQSLGSLRRHD